MTPGAMTPGFTTPSGDLDLIKIGEARKSLVGVKLDQVCSEYTEQSIGHSILMRFKSWFLVLLRCSVFLHTSFWPIDLSTE